MVNVFFSAMAHKIILENKAWVQLPIRQFYLISWLNEWIISRFVWKCYSEGKSDLLVFCESGSISNTTWTPLGFYVLETANPPCTKALPHAPRVWLTWLVWSKYLWHVNLFLQSQMSPNMNYVARQNPKISPKAIDRLCLNRPIFTGVINLLQNGKRDSLFYIFNSNTQLIDRSKDVWQYGKYMISESYVNPCSKIIKSPAESVIIVFEFYSSGTPVVKGVLVYTKRQDRERKSARAQKRIKIVYAPHCTRSYFFIGSQHGNIWVKVPNCV